MIIHRKLSEMKNRTLPTCLQENCGDSLGEFLNTSYGEVEAERVKLLAIFSEPSQYFNWDSRRFSFSLCPFCYTIGNCIKFTNINVNIK